jgi:CheY-like chemotaxis protein
MPGSYVLLAGPATRSRERALAALRAAGYQVVEAADGAQAVERTSSSQPDLVIFDLSVTVQDAREFGEAQRACDVLQSTPTVVIVGRLGGPIPEGLPAADDVIESADGDARLLAAVRQFCLPPAADAVTDIAASFTSRTGDVACPMHAPLVGSPAGSVMGGSPPVAGGLAARSRNAIAARRPNRSIDERVHSGRWTSRSETPPDENTKHAQAGRDEKNGHA